MGDFIQQAWDDANRDEIEHLEGRIERLEARERELEKALTLMIVHGKADLLDETDFEFAEKILTKIDKEPNNES